MYGVLNVYNFILIYTVFTKVVNLNVILKLLTRKLGNILTAKLFHKEHMIIILYYTISFK